MWGTLPQKSSTGGTKNKKRLVRFTNRLMILALYGAPGAIRTPDRLVRSQVLYPTELRALGRRHYTDMCGYSKQIRRISYGGERGITRAARSPSGPPSLRSSVRFTSGKASNLLIYNIEGSNAILDKYKRGPADPFCIYGGERGIRTLDGAFDPILP